MSQTRSHLNRIARAASLVMVLFIVSRVLGLLREIIIARQFGTSAELDAYVTAFRLPDFLFYVVAGGALGSAFIPVFTGYLTREDVPGAWKLASAVINWMVLLLSGLGGLAAILAPWLVATLFSEFSPDQQALTAELMRWMLVSTVIFGVSGVVMGILNAHQHFLLPALAPIFYNGSIIVAAVVLGPTWGVRGLTLGVVVGALLHLLVQIPGLFQQRMVYHLSLAPRNPSLHQVARLMAPRTLGLAAVQLNFVVTVILAARLPEGSISALNYGWIIMLLPQGVIAQSVATALFPTLAALVAAQKLSEFRHVFGTTLRNMLFLTFPAMLGLLILSEPVVRLLLQGQAFTAESTSLTAWALGFFALGLVGHASVEITTRAFYALQDTITPVSIGLAAIVANIGLSFGLMAVFERGGLPPHGGLALANALAVTAEMVVLLWLLRPRMDGLFTPGTTASLWKMGAATLGMGGVLLIVLPFLPDGRFGGVIGVVLGGVVYLGLAHLLRVEELGVVQQMLLRRVRRR